MNNYSFVILAYYSNYLIVKKNNKLYSLYIINNHDLGKYKNIIKSNYIKKPDLINNDANQFFYLRDINKSEAKAKNYKLYELAYNIFNEYSYSITLKKEHMTNIKNLTKVLDNKFRYLELRIIEEESAIIKDDFSWIFLSKVHSIMDIRVVLYDLIGDIFSAIDKEEILKYGLIFTSYSSLSIINELLVPSVNYYYGPIGAFFSRIYLSFNNNLDITRLKDNLKKLDKLNKKYFCFLTLYVLTLNLIPSIIRTNTTLTGFINTSKDIDYFLFTFKDVINE